MKISTQIYHAGLGSPLLWTKKPIFKHFMPVRLGCPLLWTKKPMYKHMPVMTKWATAQEAVLENKLMKIVSHAANLSRAVELLSNCCICAVSDWAGAHSGDSSVSGTSSCVSAAQPSTSSEQ